MDEKVWFHTTEIKKLLNGQYVPPCCCEIDLSNQCQLKCSFCMYKKYRSKENGHLDTDVYYDLLQNLKDEGVKAITFTGGGEPLVHPDAVAMIEKAVIWGFEIGLITNGINLNRIPVHLLNNLMFIRISLDAADRKTYLAIKGADKFKSVVSNIEYVVNNRSPHLAVGLSYVVCENNDKQQLDAKKLSRSLGVDYIQFKPAFTNGDIFPFNPLAKSGNTIITNRYRASNSLPCSVAGLVGVVGANARVYYCCQHRGNPYYDLGDLSKDRFTSLWIKRLALRPKFEECPQCRYMNYYKAYNEIPPMFIQHINFL